MITRLFWGQRANKRGFLVFAALAAIAMAMLLIREDIERRFIYFPIREMEADPSHLGLSFENIYFMAEDGVTLHGWFVPGEKKLTWLWFHGNAGNISHRLENIALLHEKLGVSIFIFDYRGYGYSAGTPSEKGTYLDAEGAINYLYSRADIQHNPTIYFGRSIGASIAVEMAARHTPAGLILESPFPSIPYIARHHYPFFPIWPFLSTRYDAISRIGQAATPLLVLHGDRDDVVPLEAGQKIFEAAKGDKSFYIIPGAGHNNTYLIGGESYFRELLYFIQKLEKE